MKIAIQHKFLAVFVLLYSVTVSLVLFVSYSNTVNLMLTTTDDLLVSHLKELRRVLESEGPQNLIKDLDEEVSELGTLSAFFLFKNPSTQLAVSGDRVLWADVLNRFKEGDWSELSEQPLTLKTSLGAARIARIATPDGGEIVGALSTRNLDVLAQQYFETGIAALIVLILAATLGVYSLMRGMLSQVRGIVRQAGAIDSIGTKARLPITGTGNEFDSLAEAINRLLEQLQKSKEAFHQTADHLAHELRTPLTRLRSSAELAHARGDTGHAPETLEQVETMLELTNSMLDLSILEVDKRVPNPEVIDLHVLVGLAVQLFAEGEHGRDVRFDSGATVVATKVVGNRHILERVISNLLDNALKYAPSGPVVVSMTRDEQLVTVSVGDSGPGIREEFRQRIFDRFFRVPSVKNSEVPGFGLGLSFVKAAVEAHGGTVSVICPNEGGTRLMIEIPLAKESSRPEFITNR